MFRRGYLKIALIRGIPIRFHWTAPLGAVLFSWFRFVPAYWVAFLLLVLLHELGHAYLVRRFGLRMVSVDVHGLGGLCRYEGAPSPVERSIIAWGGVLAQLLVLVITLLLVFGLGTPTNVYVAQVVRCFTWTNLFIIVFNLLPLPPLDGAEAWKIFRHFGGRKAERENSERRKRAREARKKAREAAAGEGVVIVDQGSVEESVREALRKAREEAKRSREKG